MHRFGRTEQKWRDKWGGGFLVATVLALAGAWLLGGMISRALNPAGTEITGIQGEALTGSGLSGVGSDAVPAVPVDLAAYPRSFSVYLLQAGAFKNPQRAEQFAADLSLAGLPAHVSQSGEWNKVFVGAYSTPNAARSAKAQLTNQYEGLESFPVQMSIQADPVQAVITPQAIGAYDQGIAALSGYLQAASGWWDSYAAGVPTAPDLVTSYATQAVMAAQELSGQSNDAAVTQFAALADRAVSNSAQISALAGGGGLGAEQYRVSMNGYLALLDDYRAWTGNAR